jgi:hypothetical protein
MEIGLDMYRCMDQKKTKSRGLAEQEKGLSSLERISCNRSMKEGVKEAS